MEQIGRGHPDRVKARGRGRREIEGMRAGFHYLFTTKVAKGAKDFVGLALHPLQCNISYKSYFNSYGGTLHTITEYNFPNPHPAHIHPHTDTLGRGQESHS